MRRNSLFKRTAALVLAASMAVLAGCQSAPAAGTDAPAAEGTAAETTATEAGGVKRQRRLPNVLKRK